MMANFWSKNVDVLLHFVPQMAANMQRVPFESLTKICEIQKIFQKIFDVCSHLSCIFTISCQSLQWMPLKEPQSVLTQPELRKNWMRRCYKTIADDGQFLVKKCRCSTSFCATNGYNIQRVKQPRIQFFLSSG